MASLTVAPSEVNSGTMAPSNSVPWKYDSNFSGDTFYKANIFQFDDIWHRKSLIFDDFWPGIKILGLLNILGIQLWDYMFSNKIFEVLFYKKLQISAHLTLIRAWSSCQTDHTVKSGGRS